jgi:hypothetical protein
VFLPPNEVRLMPLIQARIADPTALRGEAAAVVAFGYGLTNSPVPGRLAESPAGAGG